MKRVYAYLASVTLRFDSSHSRIHTIAKVAGRNRIQHWASSEMPATIVVAAVAVRECAAPRETRRAYRLQSRTARTAQRSTSYLSSRPPFFLRERLLAAPAKFETEIKRQVPHGVARTRLSLVPHEIQIRPVCADFGQTPQRISDIKD
jgi:hypothetical protein